MFRSVPDYDFWRGKIRSIQTWGSFCAKGAPNKRPRAWEREGDSTKNGKVLSIESEWEIYLGGFFPSSR